MEQKLTGDAMGEARIYWHHFEDCKERYVLEAIFYF